MGKVRIGIDVGGTFTDAVVIDNDSYEVTAKKKILTTHNEGVAHGIVQIISELMREHNILPQDVMFIAHGTTQATNALLEGDVAHVGILGMATGMDAIGAKNDTAAEKIELAPGKYLKSDSQFIDSKKLNDAAIEAAISELLGQGAQVIVASEAFSVDDPSNELKVMQKARDKGIYSTGGHEISQLYGLKKRTRTAVVNASLIPKMVETADMTEKAVKDTKIESNLMIMRCDGGVMSVDEVRSRPILTMLSGLAAGVAGALMYEKISDGIFFEAGGTSVDISVIKNGRVMIKYAQVGGHKTYLQSLDVRTLGVAGGSMMRVSNGKIVDVGPRSAHIAGLDYECFAAEGVIKDPKIQLVSPRPGDPCEYAIITTGSGKYSLTLAGAANLLGYVPEGDYARGVLPSARTAWQALGEYMGTGAEEAARQAIDVAAKKLAVIVNELIDEYELQKDYIVLVGGGGSGSVVVNALAEKMGVKCRMAKNAPYISTIGVALAMVREQIERTVQKPSETDIQKIRTDIIEQIVRSGAVEETVDVAIEIDSQKNILRAIATGATELRQKDLNVKAVSEEQLKQPAAEALGVEVENVSLSCSAGRWYVFSAKASKKILFGLIKQTVQKLAVVDREGVVRLRRENAQHLKFRKKDRARLFNPFLDENTTYSDANATIPKVFVFYKEKMLDLTGLHTAKQVYSILDVETEMLQGDDEIIVALYK